MKLLRRDFPDSRKNMYSDSAIEIGWKVDLSLKDYLFKYFRKNVGQFEDFYYFSRDFLEDSFK